MRNGEGALLRNEIGQRQSAQGRLRRELRERCERYAARRAADGASQMTIAGELGVSAMTIRRWLHAEAEPSAAALLPVRIAPSRPPVVAGRVVVTTPRGLRIEGLEFDAVCAIIARLG